MFRALRITILLIILVNVAVGTCLTRVRATSWDKPLRVMIYPINADGSTRTGHYISTLIRGTFKPIVKFINEEGQRHGVTRRDLLEVYLGSEVRVLPPPPPYGANVVRIMQWSLGLRLWAWRYADHAGQADPHVRMFVLLYDPAQAQKVAHSLGLQKGMIGVVHAFASDDQAEQNNVVLAHELLHTLGATDKYDPADNQPIFPEGYGEPGKVPPLPQDFAELMAGRIAISKSSSEMPPSLKYALIGDKTAQEIGWAP